jgi:hypothetical protein
VGKVIPNPDPYFPDWEFTVLKSEASFLVGGALFWIDPTRWGITLNSPNRTLLRDKQLWSAMIPLIESSVQAYSTDGVWTTNWDEFITFARPTTGDNTSVHPSFHRAHAVKTG